MVKPSRCFTQATYELAAIWEKAGDRIRLTREFKADLAWWYIFLNQWNGLSFIWDHLHHYQEVTVFNDASGSWDCGALTAQSWIQHQWLPETGNLSIAHKELIPIVIACFVWGRRWSKKVVQSDNEAVVTMLTKLSSRDKSLTHLLGCIVFLAAKHGFELTASHIPGKQNTLADAISRNNLKQFYSQAPKIMDENPIPVPAGLPQLLYVSQPDWLSLAWTSQFKSFMQQD